MNFRKQIADKKQMEETKTNLKIRILREKKPRGLVIMEEAPEKDKDVRDFNARQMKRKEIQLANGAELTQSLGLKLKKAA